MKSLRPAAITGALQRFNTELFGFGQHIRSAQEKWRDARWYVRLPLLLVVLAWLVFRSTQFLQTILTPAIEAFAEPYSEVYGNTLVYFDFFVTLGLVAAVVVLLSLFAGRISVFGSGIVTFIISGALFFCGFVLLPEWLSGPYVTALKPPGFVWPKPGYIDAAVVAAFGFALTFGDGAARPTSIRWWTLPFLFVVGSRWTAIPILWWSAVAWWLPSRFWGILRPILAGLTCLLPVAAFFVGETIVDGIPVFDQAGQRIELPTRIDCYGAWQNPDSTELYLRCVPFLYAVDPVHHGKPKILSNAGFQWNEGAFDFKRGRAHLFDGMNTMLYSYDIAGGGLKTTTSVPTEKFPAQREVYHSCFDPVGDAIVIAENEGVLAVIDAASLQVRAWSFLGTFAEVAKIECLPKRRELVVLQTARISVVRLDDLTMIRNGDLPEYSYGMGVDEQGGRVWVTYPQSMKVAAYLLDDLLLERVIDGPLAARPVGVDSERNLLFVGAVSGAVEVRSPETGERIDRVRLTPWTRRLMVMPERGEVLVTGRGYPVLWNYTGSDRSFSFFDSVLSIAEQGYQWWTTRKAGKKNFALVSNPSNEIWRVPQNENRALIAMTSAADLAAGSAILREIGYTVRAVTTSADLKQALSDGDFDLTLVDRSMQMDVESVAADSVVLTAAEDGKGYDAFDGRQVLIPLSLREIDFKLREIHHK